MNHTFTSRSAHCTNTSAFAADRSMLHNTQPRVFLGYQWNSGTEVQKCWCCSRRLLWG